MKPKIFILLILLCLFHYTFAQVTVEFRKTALNVEVGTEDVTIPIELDFENTGGAAANVQVKITKQGSTNINVTELAKINPRDEVISFQIQKGEEFTRAFYVVVKKDFAVQNNSTVTYHAQFVSGSNATPSNGPVVITLKKSKDQVLSLSDYFGDQDAKLKYVTKVEPANSVLTVYGYHQNDGNAIAKRQIALQEGESFIVKQGWLSLYNLQVSLLSVPFKIRPAQGSLITTSSASVSNLGLNFDFFGHKRERYSASGNKLSYRIAPGLFIAPSAEELDSVMTQGKTTLKTGEKSKQMFVTGGLNLTVSINNITFVFTPLAFDFATSEIGRNWVYNRKRWWGFGIGVDPKIIASIVK